MLFNPFSPEKFVLRVTLNIHLLVILGVVGMLPGLTPAVFAVPAFPDPVEVTQPDGTVFPARLLGDEFFAWYQTAKDNRVVVRDQSDGYWKYAQPNKSQSGYEAIPGAVVGVVDPDKLLPDKSTLLSPDNLQAIHAQAYSRIHGPAIDAPAPDNKDLSSTPKPPIVKIPVSGTLSVKNIVILACFSDHWSGSTVSSSYGRTNTTEYSNLFNQVNHTSDGAVGSVRDFYDEVSYGKLTVQSVVTPWVQLPQNEAYYGTNTSGNDQNPRQMVVDAIAAADAAGFDFSQGDGDGDGWVDCLTIIHSGHGEELTGNPSTCIWSHQGSMTALQTADGVKMLRYHTEPALRGNTSSTSIIRVGVICHEMGHFFGLPDLYDYSALTHGIGRWGLMAGGSWNGSDGKSPAHFCAWSKMLLGFVTPQLKHSASSVALPAVETSPDVHLYRDGLSDNEYFLVENRAKLGFDNTNEIFPGLLVLHVDDKSANNDLNTWPHPAVKIEEADGNNSLGLKTATSQNTDVWHSGSGLAGGFRDQTGDQDCNAMAYQSGQYYNRTNNSTYYSYLRLNTFSAASANMTYTAATLIPTVADQTVFSGNYTVNWGAATNATQYEIQEGSSVTLTSFSDGAESEDMMYQNWAISGTVQRSSAGKRSGSYSYVLQYLDNAAGKWYPSVQALTMREPFTVTASSAISFYMVSQLADNGYLKCQVSKDGGDTWLTLGSYVGWQSTWAQKSFSYANLTALGVTAGDECQLRFVANFEQAYGWTNFPSYGFAIDDIALTGVEIVSYGNWTTLNNNVAGTSYPISGKTAGGDYAYRVRAYANSTWQSYSPAGVTTAALPPYQYNIHSGGGCGFTENGTAADPFNCSSIDACINHANANPPPAGQQHVFYLSSDVTHAPSVAIACKVLINHWPAHGNVTVTGTLTSGVGGDVTIDGNFGGGGQIIFDGGANQAYASGGSITISNCILRNSINNNARIDNGGTLTLANCELYGAAGNGVANQGGTLNCTGCTIRNNAMSGVYHVIIAGNSTLNDTDIYSNLDGIRCNIPGSTVYLQNGSRIFNNLQNGIAVQLSATLTAEDCEIYDNTWYGVRWEPTGTSNTTNVFRRCQLRTGNTYALFKKDDGCHVDTCLVEDPVFTGRCGDIAFELGDGGTAPYPLGFKVQGTNASGSTRVDFDPMINAGTIQYARILNGCFQLFQCTGSKFGSGGNPVIDTYGTLTGDVVINSVRGLWKNGAGTIANNATGGAYRVDVLANNTAWVMDANPANNIWSYINLDYGSTSTAACRAYLKNCTFKAVNYTYDVIARLINGDTSRNDLLYLGWCILDSAGVNLNGGSASVAGSNLTPRKFEEYDGTTYLNSPCNCYRSDTVTGLPAPSGGLTIYERNPNLTVLGALNNNSWDAIMKAAYSPNLLDINKATRPNPSGSTVDIGAYENNYDDRTAPTGTIVVNGGAAWTNNTNVTLTLSASDGGSGVWQMRILDGNGVGSWEDYATTHSAQLASTNGSQTVAVGYVDNMRNGSGWFSDTISLDTVQPTGSISINSGAALTTSRNVTLNLSAADTGGSGVAQMRVGNTPGAGSWEAYSSGDKAWELSAGEGTKTVYITYRDTAGNPSTEYSDTIDYYTATPTVTNTPDATATDTPEPTATDTLEPTATNTPEPTATDTLEPTATDTPEPTATDTLEPTATDTPEPTATDTPEPTATNTPEPTATDTPEPTATDTLEPTATDTPESTVTDTPDPLATSTPEPTATDTPDPLATDTPEPTVTDTPDPLATDTPEPTATDTPGGPTATPTATWTPVAPSSDVESWRLYR